MIGCDKFGWLGGLVALGGWTLVGALSFPAVDVVLNAVADRSELAVGESTLVRVELIAPRMADPVFEDDGWLAATALEVVRESTPEFGRSPRGGFSWLQIYRVTAREPGSQRLAALTARLEASGDTVTSEPIEWFVTGAAPEAPPVPTPSVDPPQVETLPPAAPTDARPASTTIWQRTLCGLGAGLVLGFLFGVAWTRRHRSPADAGRGAAAERPGEFDRRGPPRVAGPKAASRARLETAEGLEELARVWSEVRDCAGGDDKEAAALDRDLERAQYAGVTTDWQALRARALRWMSRGHSSFDGSGT